MSEERYKEWRRVLSLVLIVVGILGIAFVPIWYAFTNSFEFGLLAGFGTIAGVGQGFGVLQDIKDMKPVDPS